MKITVKALPVSDIMVDLAQSLNATLEEDCGELTLPIPEKMGKGFIRGVSFESGVGFIHYKCTFFEDVEMHFTVKQTHPLRFIFCSEGRIQHAFVENEERHNIETYQNVIASSSKFNGHVLFFRANESVNASSLEIIRNIFSHRNQYRFIKFDPVLAEVFRDSVAEKIFFYQGNYSIKAADIVDEINNKDSEGFVRSVLVEGKALEMLSKQVAQYQDDHRDDLPQILRRSDVEKVKRAAELIHNNLSQNHSVDYLAKEVGTNVNKLQEGFKYMFDLTVNKYVQQVKLEAARDLLTNTDHNISQIVNLIGLNNRSYFSKIFKEKYGVSPKYFLRNQKEQPDGSEAEDE